MRLEAFTNRIIPFREQLSDELLNCTSFSIASCFIDSHGIDVLDEALTNNMGIRTGRLLVGTYGCFNKKADLERLQKLAIKHAVKLAVHISRKRSFHWKYYQVMGGKKQSIYVGSANLTSGGMGNNSELMAKLSDSMTAKDNGFKRLQGEFEKEWQYSGTISDFNIDKYKENRASFVSNEIRGGGNEGFFERKTSPKLGKTDNERAILALFTEGVSTTTEKIVRNSKPTWETDYLICNDKQDFERCKSVGRMVKIDRERKGLLYAYWVRLVDDLVLQTPNGKYFISYVITSKVRKLRTGVISTFPEIIGRKLEGRTKILDTKTIGKRQVAQIERLFGITEDL